MIIRYPKGVLNKISTKDEERFRMKISDENNNSDFFNKKSSGKNYIKMFDEIDEEYIKEIS